MKKFTKVRVQKEILLTKLEMMVSKGMGEEGKESKKPQEEFRTDLNINQYPTAQRSNNTR